MGWNHQLVVLGFLLLAMEKLPVQVRLQLAPFRVRLLLGNLQWQSPSSWLWRFAVFAGVKPVPSRAGNAPMILGTRCTYGAGKMFLVAWRYWQDFNLPDHSSIGDGPIPSSKHSRHGFVWPSSEELGRLGVCKAQGFEAQICDVGEYCCCWLRE